MTQAIYHSEHHGRNLLNLFGFTICAVLTVFGYLQGAPWYWMLVVWLPALALLHSLVINTHFELSIEPSLVLIKAGSNTIRIENAQIEKVKITTWSDGPNSYRIHLRNGESHSIFTSVIKDETQFKSALDTVGITHQTN